MRFAIEQLSHTPVRSRRIELAECKGLAHPDTLCDSLVEAVSRGLSSMYLRELGFVAHFNVDKALLAAGECQKTFGSGRLIRPMRLFLGDRATFFAGERALPVIESAQTALRRWLERYLPTVRLGRELILEPALAQGSAPLRGIYAQPVSETISNDTSGAAGFAPFSPTEEVVLRTQRFLNGEEFKGRFPDTGQDVKIFAMRDGRKLSLTVAMPFLCSAIDSEKTYFRRKEEVLHALHQEICHPELDIDWVLNSLDRTGAGPEGVYLTLTGTSAEDADSGQVGRGNRAYGFIAFARPVGGEAAPGKNPIAHVGKIYSGFSQHLAKLLHSRFPDLIEVYVNVATRIGEPVRNPWVGVQVVLPPGRSLKDFADPVQSLVAEEIDHLPEFCERLIRGEFAVV